MITIILLLWLAADLIVLLFVKAVDDLGHNFDTVALTTIGIFVFGPIWFAMLIVIIASYPIALLYHKLESLYSPDLQERASAKKWLNQTTLKRYLGIGWRNK